jgi:TonB family protein
MLKYILLTCLSVVTGLTLKAQPTFKGGPNAFESFLNNNIIYPDFSKRNCIAATIRVGFLVDEKGKVSDVKVQQGPGIDLDDEAVRVVKMTSGKWVIPAGFTGAARIILPVRFTPDYQYCNTAGSARMDMNTAINSYQIRQEQENAVTNYYINKYKGEANPAKEASINALKAQLGIDDELYSELLDRANQKLKQGDKEGACEDWKFIKNTGSDKADTYIARYCK